MKSWLYMLGGVLLFSCSSNKPVSEQDALAYENLRALVASKKFEISSHTAKPTVSTAFQQVANTNVLGVGNNASNISIIGNTNYLRIKGDTISGFFPFYGEQHFGSGGYGAGSHQGIEFKDVPEAFEVKENEAKRRIELEFRIPDEYRNNEDYNVYVILFPNNTSSIRIQSTTRSSIEYAGRIVAMVEDGKVK